MTLSRAKKMRLNSIAGLLKQLIALACGFILPKLILSAYGSEVNGLLSSIAQFLGFIAFLEMGIGPVIQSNLYGPLAKKDVDGVSRIFKSSSRFFRRIAYIFIGYVVVLLFIYPLFINNDFDYLFTGSLIIIISVSTLAEYFFGINYQLLLNADQLGFVQMFVQSIALILNTLLSFLLIRFGCSIHVVKIVSALIYIARPLTLMVIVKAKYKINKRIELKGEPIKQKWNGFAQHLAATVVANTDVVVLTLFSTLTNVSIYSVYYLVVRGVSDVVMASASGLEALWGNMIANKEDERLIKSYHAIEWVMHNVVTLLFTITAVLIVPFIQIYTSGINDANYYQPIFSVLLVCAYGFQCLRVPYFRIIKAAGHYKQTQMGSIIQMIINLSISIILVIKFQLLGVAIGTFIAMAFHTIYFAFYLTKNIIKRDIWFFLKNIIIDCILVFTIFVVTFKIKVANDSYFNWVLSALLVSLVSVCCCLFINYVFNYQEIKMLLNYLKSKKRH